MPQLDKLIILTQYKVFLFIFFLVYFVLLFMVLPKLNLTLRVRKAKFRNLFSLLNKLRTSYLFIFLKSKEKFLGDFVFFVVQDLISRVSLRLKSKIKATVLEMRSFLTKV